MSQQRIDKIIDSIVFCCDRSLHHSIQKTRLGTRFISSRASDNLSNCHKKDRSIGYSVANRMKDAKAKNGDSKILYAVTEWAFIKGYDEIANGNSI